jgi:hypothetical protein
MTRFFKFDFYSLYHDNPRDWIFCIDRIKGVILFCSFLLVSAHTQLNLLFQENAKCRGNRRYDLTVTKLCSAEFSHHAVHILTVLEVQESLKGCQ